MTDEYLSSVSSDFDYKEYSLQQLDNWVNDALNNESLSSQELYDSILKTITESVEYHKRQLKKGNDLLSLMKGNRNVDLMCDKEKEREYNRRETEYYNKRAFLDANLDVKHSSYYYDYDRNDPNRTNPFTIPDYTEL